MAQKVNSQQNLTTLPNIAYVDMNSLRYSEGVLQFMVITKTESTEMQVHIGMCQDQDRKFGQQGAINDIGYTHSEQIQGQQNQYQVKIDVNLEDHLPTPKKVGSYVYYPLVICLKAQ